MNQDYHLERKKKSILEKATAWDQSLEISAKEKKEKLVEMESMYLSLIQ